MVFGLYKLKKNMETTILETKVDYQIYHNDYSSAIEEALEFAEKNDYEIDKNYAKNEIASVSFQEPKHGQINYFAFFLYKKGGKDGADLHFRILGFENKYELNVVMRKYE